ncbi:unnamed protein product, partial [Rotaria magnacalcarata]
IIQQLLLLSLNVNKINNNRNIKISVAWGSST